MLNPAAFQMMKIYEYTILVALCNGVWESVNDWLFSKYPSEFLKKWIDDDNDCLHCATV